jgi:hypothetical protein
MALPKPPSAVLFCLIGFLSGMSLCAYTFYLTSHHLTGNPFLFLFLCPFSIAAMALQNAGIAAGIFGWLIISCANAILYGAIAAELTSLKRSKHATFDAD